MRDSAPTRETKYMKVKKFQPGCYLDDAFKVFEMDIKELSLRRALPAKIYFLYRLRKECG